MAEGTHDRPDPLPPGTVALVGTPIGNLGDLSPRAVAALRAADVICCEDTRRTRALLSSAGIPTPRLVAIERHREAAGAAQAVARAQRGERVAVVTDAGMPGVSDPGERLVAAAVEAGVVV
ncbi:MAG: SAM-dependent methyltransferase, partial [Acidimicrobiales bacterium]